MNRNGQQLVIFVMFFLLIMEFPVHSENVSEDVVKQSDIVFTGTVTQLGAVSFPGVSATPSTIVVRIDKVLEKPNAVTLTSEQNVTVEVKDPSKFVKGAHATFYTTGWIFGEGVAVREVGHELAGETPPFEMASEKTEELNEIRRKQQNAQLLERIESADIVVVGKVIMIRPNTMESSGGSSEPITEHDPDWQEAIVRVESPIKGATENQEIVVRFPKSMDVTWFNIPKFKKDQEGVFLLKKDQVTGVPESTLHGDAVKVYMAMEKQDVLSKNEAQRIRKLAEQ